MKFYLATVTLAAVAIASVHSFQIHPTTTTVRPTWRLSSTATPKVEKLDNSAVSIDIPVPGAATKAAYSKVCMELSKTVQIPGFRKGSKIPPQVLEAQMSAKGGRNVLKVQAINELVKQLVEPALKDQALDPIGQPTLKVSAEELAESFVAGEELVLQVQCDVWPEIQWNDGEGDEKPYVGITGKYTRKAFNQEKLDLATNDLRERYASQEPITDALYALRMGDACKVNMDGYMANGDEKGEKLPDAASGDNVEVLLGSGRYMDGLVEGLVGATVGQTVTISVNFPQKLRNKELAGKKAIFDVKVLEASTRSVPEITDEFAAIVKPGLNKEKLVAELRKAIDEEDSKEFTPARNKAIGAGLAKVMDVAVPDTLVTNQAREKFAMMMSDMRDGGVSDEEIKKQISTENFLKYKDIVKDDIIQDFKISMATDEIARLEGIEVADYQVEEQMESIRKDSDGEEMDENMIRSKVETTLLRQAVMDWLADKSKLEVEYADADEEFDEALMQKLADEAVQREEKLADATPSVVDAEVVKKVDTPKAEVKKVDTPKAEVKKVDTPKAETKKADTPKTEAKKAAAPAENLSVEEMAYQAILNTGAVEIFPDPNDPDYDSSNDDKAV